MTVNQKYRLKHSVMRISLCVCVLVQLEGCTNMDAQSLENMTLEKGFAGALAPAQQTTDRQNRSLEADY